MAVCSSELPSTMKLQAVDLGPLSERLQRADPVAVLLLPAYDEASRECTPKGFGLEPTIAKHRDALAKTYGVNHAVIVLDDGSRDNTAEVAENAGATVLRYETNRGRGHALTLGFLAVSSALDDLNNRAIGYTDADGSYSTEAMLQMFEAVLSGQYDYMQAERREDSGQSLLRRVAHVILRNTCEAIAPTGGLDTQAGAKVFNARVVADLWSRVTMERWGADREVAHMAYQPDLSVGVLPTDIVTVGDSRVHAISDAIAMVQDAFAIRTRHGGEVAVGPVGQQAHVSA
jgi:hypothetical protein